MIANLNRAHLFAIKQLMAETRAAAREKGIKIRRTRYTLRAYLPSGRTEDFDGWVPLADFIKRYRMDGLEE